jgi:PAS domain
VVAANPAEDIAQPPHGGSEHDGTALLKAHPRIHQAYSYWQSIHPEKGLPGRQHFDPSAVPKLLPFLWLLDVRGHPVRVRCRLIGTAISSIIGKDLTGAWLDEVDDSLVAAPACAARWNAVVTTRRPHWRPKMPIAPVAEGKVTEIEDLYLPFATNGWEVDLIVCQMVAYTRDGAALGQRSNVK